MRQTRIKTFEALDSDSLERTVNAWLTRHDNIDVKGTSLTTSNGTFSYKYVLVLTYDLL